MDLFDRFRRGRQVEHQRHDQQAEKPEKMLTQLIEDMNGQLLIKKAVASAIVCEKHLERQLLQQRTQAEDSEKLAVLAVQEDRTIWPSAPWSASRSSTSMSPATRTSAIRSSCSRDRCAT